MQAKLMSLDDVATMLGTSRAWVRDHATRRNPRIPVVRLGESGPFFDFGLRI